VKHLFNKEDWRVLKNRMEENDDPRITISFYKYWNIGNPPFFRDYLYLHWDTLGVMGRTYVASEGINAQISVPRQSLEAFIDHLYSISFLDRVRLNYAIEDDGKSFYKLIVKVRNKIVADGLKDEDFDVTDCGVHLSAKDFNEITEEESTILIDMRNHYESEVGHFEGAICPDVDTFREEIVKVEEMLQGNEDRNIVMYCTGGIRCEKASAWLKHRGFPNVHQLNGGIIEYARQVRAEGLPNKFHGKNFVFDERMEEAIDNEVIANCHQCGEPYDVHINCANELCHLLFIQCPECSDKYDACCSDDCKEIASLTEAQRRELRKGKNYTQSDFHKGRSSHLPFAKKANIRTEL
jgi:UPF0176 protein